MSSQNMGGLVATGRHSMYIRSASRSISLPNWRVGNNMISNGFGYRAPPSTVPPMAASTDASRVLNASRLDDLGNHEQSEHRDPIEPGSMNVDPSHENGSDRHGERRSFQISTASARRMNPGS